MAWYVVACLSDSCLLAPHSTHSPVQKRQLSHFAQDGLRTLLFGVRLLSEQDFNRWSHKYEVSGLRRESHGSALKAGTLD